jgi:hypothetical protein
MTSSNQTLEQTDQSLLARKGDEVGNTWDGIGRDNDGRTNAYKALSDDRRKQVDNIEAKVDRLSKNPTPNNKIEAAKELRKLATIYTSLSNNRNVSTEVASQAKKLAKYWSAYANELSSGNGTNVYTMPGGDTIKYTGKEWDGASASPSNSDNAVASSLNVESGSNTSGNLGSAATPSSSDGGGTSTKSVSEEIVNAALGDNVTSDRKQNFEKFVKSQSGKIDAETLKQIGKSYLEGSVANAAEVAKTVVESSRQVQV